MLFDKIYYGVQALINSAYGTPVAETAKTVSQIPTDPILETVKATINETASMGFFEKMSSHAAGAWSWGTTFASGTWNLGNSIISHGAGFINNLFKLASHGAQAGDRFAQAGTLVTTTFKNSLEYVDTIGIALYEGYLIISPKLLVELFQATEQRIKQNDDDASRQHPVGWGIATLMTTTAFVYLSYTIIHTLLRKTKNQNELSELSHELAHLIKIKNNRSVLSMTLSVLKTLGISATLFCVSAAISLPLFVAAPLAAGPILLPVMQWIWNKPKGEVETSQLEEVTACVQMLQTVQEGIERARFNEQARTFLLKQAQSGDPRALDRLYSLIDKSITNQPQPALETESSPVPVIIHTAVGAKAKDSEKQLQTDKSAKNKRGANKA